MNKGTLVYQINQGNLRFGTILEKYFDKKGWVHFIIDWHDDGKHIAATDWVDKLRNDEVDRHNRTYRVDEICPVSPRHLEKAVSAHMVGSVKRVTANLKKN